MREQLETRLNELQQEFQTGQRVHAELAARQEGLQQSMLRIGGAIQVLQEMLDAQESTLSTASRADDDAVPRRVALG